MTAQEIIDKDIKDRLINASNNLARAMQSSVCSDDSPIIERKGKTLYHINRERAKSVKMTVNY